MISYFNYYGYSPVSEHCNKISDHLYLCLIAVAVFIQA